MNQGKLEVVKQEMARVNVDILGISKLKWTGMGEFNSGQEEEPKSSLSREGLYHLAFLILLYRSHTCRWASK